MESENSEKKNLLKNRIWLVFPILHWGMSFFYERLILKWDANSWDIFWSESLNDRFSNSFQSIVLYTCGKIVAGVLIFLLWYGLRNIVTKFIKCSACNYMYDCASGLQAIFFLHLVS